MSGHSKWATIKRKKGVNDAKRGKIFSKLIKEITIAAKMGGGNPDDNPRLRTAIEAGKSENMPKDNIERAVKKGTGELEGVTYDESMLEGYGPGGIAILIEVATDNKNRTVSEIKHMLSKGGGNMGEVGCVSWMFDAKGIISVEKDAVDEDTLMNEALEAGAEDIINDATSEHYDVYTAVKDMVGVADALTEKEIKNSGAQMTRIPKNEIDVEGADAVRLIKLLDQLEDHDDTQKVYANFNISPDEMAKIEEALA